MRNRFFSPGPGEHPASQACDIVAKIYEDACRRFPENPTDSMIIQTFVFAAANVFSSQMMAASSRQFSDAMTMLHMKDLMKGMSATEAVDLARQMGQEPPK